MPDVAARLAGEIAAKSPFRNYPDEIPDLETAANVQDAVTTRLAGALGGFAGYKIAWNTASQQRALGLPHPGFGRVFHDQLARNGAHFPADGFHKLAIEPEIIARIGMPLGTGATEAEAETAIEGFHIGFELLERRSVPDTPDIHTVIAGNVFNAGLVLGTTAIAPRELAATPSISRVTLNSAAILDKPNAAPEPPARAVAFLADHYGRRGKAMQPGDLVLCGAHLPPYVLAPGSRLRFSLTGFEDVTMSFG